MSPYSENELIALAILPKITSLLSVIGSSYIIYKVRSSPLRQLRPNHRLMAGMSMYDILSSIAHFLSTWPSPVGTPDVKFAMGNSTTCAIQGYFSNFSIGVGLYNTCLSFYFLLIIRYKVTARRMRSIEIVLHMIPFIYAVIGGAIIAADSSFNNSGQVCWVGTVPKLCKGNDCLRGRMSSTIHWVVLGILVICTVISTLSMIAICLAVHKQNKSLRKRSYTLDERGHTTRQHKIHGIFIQALLYVAAFHLVWFFPIFNRIYFFIHGVPKIPTVMLAATVHPFQGALNALIYMRKDLLARDENKLGRKWSFQAGKSFRKKIISLPFGKSSTKQCILDHRNVDEDDYNVPSPKSSLENEENDHDHSMLSTESECRQGDIESSVHSFDS